MRLFLSHYMLILYYVSLELTRFDLALDSNISIRSLFNLTFPSLRTPSQNCLIIRSACRTEGNRRSKFWTWIIGLPDLKQKNKKFMQWKFGIGCWIPYINMIHVQNLLLLLPSVRHANLMMRQFCEGVQRYGKVKLNKLLIQHFN